MPKTLTHLTHAFALFASAILVASTAHATDLMTEPQSSIYALSIDGLTVGKMGDVSVSQPNWILAQWNNPLPLNVTSNYPFPPGQDWTVSNATTGITFSHAVSYAGSPYSQAYTLTQNGNAAGHLLPCDQEYDLFLSPTANQPLPNGMLTPKSFAQSANIGSLKRLQFDFGLQVSSETVSNRCSDVNYIGYSFNITLTSSTGKSMFWQLILRDSRGYIQANNPCVGYPQGNTYCFSSTIDYVTFFLQAQQSIGPTVQYQVSVLPFVMQAIAQTSDSNTAHWYVSGAYLGSGCQGACTGSSVWIGPMIVAY